MGTLHWGGWGGAYQTWIIYMYVYVSTLYIYIHYVYCSIIIYIYIIFTVYFWPTDVTTSARRCRVQHMLQNVWFEKKVRETNTPRMASKKW